MSRFCFLASNTVDSSSLSTSVSLSIRLVLRNLPEIKFYFHYEKSVFALRPTNNITRWHRTKSLPIKNTISSFAQAQKPQTMAISFLKSSFPWPADNKETLWSNKRNRQIWLAVEKTVSFPAILQQVCGHGRSCGLTLWLLCRDVSRSGLSIHEQSEDRWRTRSYSTGTRVFLFRFWIIPEPPALVPLDKGNTGSGNDNETIVDDNSSKNKVITTAHIPLARGRFSWCWPNVSRPLGSDSAGDRSQQPKFMKTWAILVAWNRTLRICCCSTKFSLYWRR